MWIEDSLPLGAKAQGNEGDKSWKFVKKSEEHPVLSGETSSVRTATGLSQHFFEGANPPLTINEGDVLFAHVYLNPDRDSDKDKDFLNCESEIVDDQNKSDPKYEKMSDDFKKSVAFNTACDLILEGKNQPSGYTEPLLHLNRLKKKSLN